MQTNDESVKSYTTPQEIKSQIQNDNNLSLLHLNISSLGFHINEFQDLLSTCEINFQAIGITEPRLKAHKKGLINITIPGYNFEHCPTEGNCGGTLIYIKDNLSYKNRNDLKIYKKLELESTFIEIRMKKGKDIIIGSIYKHPNLETEQFNEYFLKELSEKLLKEKIKKLY